MQLRDPIRSVSGMKENAQNAPAPVPASVTKVTPDKAADNTMVPTL
jgi:hypothetical protein